MSGSPVPEPVTAEAPRPATGPLLTQSWRDVTFVHWAVDPRRVAPLLPEGVVPDTVDGATYVGILALRFGRTGLFRLPGVPYLGTFPETNVRVYSVDGQGRRGVVFLSMDASRLLPVLAARAALRLPYQWSRMTVWAHGDVVHYASARRWPGPRDAHSRLTVRTGEPLAEPSDLEHFLTARWGLHNTVHGRPAYLPNTHPPWPLRRATLLHCDENLVAAAGLPGPLGDPVSVLYSPGVPVAFGPPARVTAAAADRETASTRPSAPHPP